MKDKKYLLLFIPIISYVYIAIGVTIIPSQTKIVSPIQNLYYHISDDNGTKPTKDTDVILLFEPDGRAIIYVEGKSDHMAMKGTWSYRSGQISLHFQTEDLRVNATFPIDLQTDEVVMPFRLFSSNRGTSRWKRQPVIVERAVIFVFRGEVLSEAPKVDADKAITRAVDFANAVIQIGKRQVKSFFMNLANASNSQNKLPKVVRPLKNGIEVEHEDGTNAEVLLFSWSPPPPGTLELKPSKLVTDPRVHLNAKPSGNTEFDPDNKTALFISPFHTGRINSWFDRIFDQAKNSGIVSKLGDSLPWDKIKERLKKRGYNIKELKDENVTVERLIKTFVDLKDPGIVIFLTHGTSSGSLLTGEQLTETDDVNEANQKFEELKNRLKEAGHRRLVEDDGVGIMKVELGLKAQQDSAWFVSIKPYFWFYLQWLVTRPVSFKKTLFYVGACYTDSTKELREAIQAKAYFAWKASIHPELNGAVLYFLIESLARPTRSAEEAYYNLVRVVNTRENIHKEDLILKGKVPVGEVQEGVQSPLFQNLENYLFNGYGSENGKLIRYAGNGWLDPSEVNVGQVWWLVFAGRWGQDVEEGVKNLKDCYDKFWAKKKHGRLKSPFCNSAHAGKIPKKPEVSYACYLLNGDRPEGYTGQVIPRWTLNEGQ